MDIEGDATLRVDAEMLRLALLDPNGNVSLAAAKLGQPWAWLQRGLREFGIAPSDRRPPRPSIR